MMVIIIHFILFIIYNNTFTYNINHPTYIIICLNKITLISYNSLYKYNCIVSNII